MRLRRHRRPRANCLTEARGRRPSAYVSLAAGAKASHGETRKLTIR
jgi:hypothetical protein